MKRIFIIHLLLIPALLFLVTACDSSSDPLVLGEEYRGRIIETEQTATYTADYISALFTIAGDDINIQPLYGVTVHKIIYYTIDTDNNIVEASGAIYIPNTTTPLSILSLQHGTQSDRDLVASVNPLLGVEGLIGASVGYYSAEADYLGLGTSTMMHPYHHAKSSATCIIDFLRAARQFASNNNVLLNNQLFLAGYSEGGFVTLATQKEIEANYGTEFQLTAVAAMAGAYNLVGSTAEIIQKGHYDMPGFVSFLLTAYNNIYGWNRLNDFFNEPYASRISSLFNGTKRIDQINLELTTDLTSLFKQAFIEGIRNETEINVMTALSENSLLDWTPVSPLLLVHGDADEYVPYSNSVTAFNTFVANGANVDLVTITGGTHATAVIPAIITTMEWFSGFSSQYIILVKK